MKKVLKYTTRVLVLFIIVTVYISGYLTVSGQTKDIKEEKVKIEKKAEKVTEEQEVQEKQDIQPVQNEVIETPQIIPANRIIAGGVTNNLVYDNGDYFYLDHNLNGVYDGRGVPFIDFRTNFATRKTIIYAHSNQQGTGPFQALQNYHNNPGYFYSHPIIEVYYNGAYYRYQIFSVYISTANSDYDEGLEYFQSMYYNDITWEQAINNYKNNSEYDTGVSVNGKDKILILQTCSMDPNNYERYYRYNLLIMGKLV